MLESVLRCPATGIAGPYTVQIDGGFFATDTCTGTLTQSGSSVSLPLSCPVLGLISLTGSVSGNTVALTEVSASACFGNTITASLTIENDCNSAAGSFSCSLTSGSLTVTRN